MFGRRFKAGDRVVYRKAKYTMHPGRRAREIRAARKGDNYAYFVDKFWVVRRVLDSGDLLVETPGGKTHVIDQRDPNLRHPTPLQRLLYRSRFAKLRLSNSSRELPAV